MTRTSFSGVETTFKDKNGKAIKVHDYVKDGEGNRYFINSHCQAVPEGGDAPAVELSRLIESTEVSVMTMEEVLNIKPPVERRRRGGRHKKEEAAPAEAPAGQAHVEVEHLRKEDLSPVDEQMVLSLLPDDVLAAELRRRGYTLCAVRPALIEL